MTVYYGKRDSSQVLAAKLAYGMGVARLQPVETPVLSLVSPNLQNLTVAPGGEGTGDGTAGGSTSIKYAEKTYRVGRTTLNGAINSSVTTLVLDDAYAETGWVVQMGEETILLGETADRLTFTGCTRSVGDAAGEAHVDGVDVLILGKSYVEGAAASTGGLIVTPSEVTNYLENYQMVADVTGSMRFLNEYYEGNGDKLAAALAEHNMYLKHQLEHRLIWGTAVARVGKTTAGVADGIYARVAGTAAVDMSDDLITYTDVQKAIRAMRKRGARPSAIVCSYYQADYFNNLGIAHITLGGSEAAQVIYGTVVPTLRVGDIMLDIIATDKMDDNAMIITPQNIKVGPKEVGRHFHPEALGKEGDSDQVMIVGEYTFQVELPWSHYWFKNVAREAT
jgi:hypothetical protein